MKIALDFDSTLANTLENWTKQFAEKYKDRKVPKPIDVVSWDIAAAFGLTWEEMNEIFQEVRTEKHLKYAAPMDSNWFYWVKKLQGMGHEFTVISSNTDETIPFIKYWLSKYGLDSIPIYITKNSKDKFTYDWSVIVDDAPGLHDLMPIDGRTLLLYNNPWNDKIELNSNSVRVWNFKDVYYAVKALDEMENMNGSKICC